MRSVLWPVFLGLIACTGEVSTTPDEDEGIDTADHGDEDVSYPENNTIEEAVSVSFDDEGVAIVEDAIEVSGDRDFWALDLTAGTNYTFWASGGAEDGDPDCVIRLYNTSKSQISENDDLPHRIYGTDPGMIFRPTETGTYYVEVLEWGDWAGESAQGAASYKYSLVALEGAYEEGNEDGPDFDNDSIELESLNVDTLDNEDTTLRRYSWYLDPFSSLGGADGGYLFAIGDIGEAGDVDTYGMSMDLEESEATVGYFEVSLMPDLVTEFDPIFEVFNEAGDLVASTDDPVIYPEYFGLDYNVGISFLITESGKYFLQVSDANGASGSDIWYSLIANYGTYVEEVTLHDNAEGVNVVTDAVDLQVQESTSTAGTNYGWMVGRFEEGNTFDSFKVNDGVAAGKYLNIELSTDIIGSSADALINVYDASGESILSSAVSENPDGEHGDDPAVVDFEIPADVSGPIYVSIENEGEVTGDSAFYKGIMYLTNDPLN